MKKKCFVISPIGEEGSEIRKAANDLYDLIIEPAFEKFDFIINRGDKSVNTLTITEDIISQIENSELCIIDLTGRNPNVFYECGLRHGTGKPFILIRKKGEVIPFDLSHMRVVDYDLSDARKTRESVESLRKFINEYESIGYSSQSSSVSLNDIALALKRIERRIESGITAPSVSAPPVGNPSSAYTTAFKNQQYDQAAMALKKFMTINKDVNLHLDMASSLIEVFEPAGVGIACEILEKNFDILNNTYARIALFDLYTFHLGAANLANEKDYIKSMTEKFLTKNNLTDEEKAGFYNILASVEYSLKNDMEALKYQKKTIENNPSEPAYLYNLSRIYASLNMKEELLENLQYLLAVAQNLQSKNIKVEVSQLEFAKNIFLENNKTDKVNEIEDLITKYQKM